MFPSFFVAHGSPMMAIEEDAYTRTLAKLAADIPRPKAIVIFSAHWEAPVQRVSSVASYSTIYDFYGFPDALYQLEYPARGDPALADKIVSLLDSSGIECELDKKRGLDHGAWTVLRYLYPNHDIPVVAMSVSPYIPPAQQFKVGQAIAALRNEDVLILGSGNTIHNFDTLKIGSTSTVPDQWAADFESWIEKHVTAWDLDAVFNHDKRAPSSTLAVPPKGKEHFSPLLYLMGTGNVAKKPIQRHRSFKCGSLSYTIWQF